MWFCSPWNPYPLQGRPGLLNEPNAPSDQWFNKGAFDWAETPPAFWLHAPNKAPETGRFLLRSTWNSGGEGALLNAQLEIAKQRFGARTGAAMFFEELRQEWFWNRNGVGNPNGNSYSGFLYKQFPHPLRVLYADLLASGVIDGPEDWATEILPTLRPIPLAFAGTCYPHFSAVYDEERRPPIIESLSVWFHKTTPIDQEFDPLEFNREGYPVYAVEALELGPNPWGRWQGPNLFGPIHLKAFSKTAAGALVLSPAW